MKFSSFVHFASFGVKTILLRKKEPILGTVIVTDKCNLKCKHCSVNNITGIIHPYDKVRAEMQTLYDMGVRILFFCGGETFLWRDGEKTLRDLVIEAKKMGFLIVNVVTNGTFPIDLPEADLILLSLDGDREHHNMIRGNTYDTILANIENGTYLAKYSIGNYKPLDLGTEGIVNMQIVGFNVDPLADGTGNAPTTWISKEVLATEFPELNEKITLNIPDEKARRVGQSVAAASLPKIVK